MRALITPMFLLCAVAAYWLGSAQGSMMFMASGMVFESLFWYWTVKVKRLQRERSEQD